MTSRPLLIILLIASVILLPLSLYYQYMLDNGNIGVADVGLYILTGIASLGAVYAVSMLFFRSNYEAAPIKLNYLFLRTLIVAAVGVVGGNFYKLDQQTNELETNAVFTKGIIIDARERGKKHEPWKVFSFTYDGKDYFGEFRDPFLKLFVGDTIVIKHSALHPQYNFPEIDTIYEPPRK